MQFCTEFCWLRYSFGAVSPWKLQRCSCGFAGDDRVLCATARTVLDLNLRNHVTPALWELHWLPITERIQYKLCLLCTRCSSGTLRITLPACWRPPPTFLHGRRCIRRVTVTWSYQERVGRSVTGLSLLLHPVLGIGCRLTWNSCVDCFIQEQTEEFSVSCCLHREHYVNSGMRHRSDCRGRTYKSLLLLLLCAVGIM